MDEPFELLELIDIIPDRQLLDAQTGGLCLAEGLLQNPFGTPVDSRKEL